MRDAREIIVSDHPGVVRGNKEIPFIARRRTHQGNGRINHSPEDLLHGALRRSLLSLKDQDGVGSSRPERSDQPTGTKNPVAITTDID
jgi:hypothetical protein